MAEKSQKTLFGLSPAIYGIASLVAACLCWVCAILFVAVVGALVIYAQLPLALFGFVSGLLGVSAGIYHKNWLAVVTAVLGMTLIGFLILFM